MTESTIEANKRFFASEEEVPKQAYTMGITKMCIRDRIYEAFGEQDGYELEIWEDAGVLEIGMSEGASVDIETAQIHPKDEVTASFAAEHQVKTVFLVTFKPETYEEAKLVMRRIMDKTGGFFCGDTEDFTPMFV